MRILVTESSGFSKKAIATLRAKGHTVSLQQYNYKSLSKVIDRYDCLIIRLGIHLDEKLLRRASHLKYIVTITTGVDHLDEKYCGKTNISLISLRGEHTFLQTITSTAELTFTLILNLYHRAIPAIQAVRNYEWNRDAYIGREVQGKIVGVIGLGRLGTLTARYSSVFGATVIYYDPLVQSRRYDKCNTLRQLAKKADIITLHVPLNDETLNIINASFFRYCKPDAVLINTSRGKIVDEKALLHALRSEQIAGAGLDVLPDEVGGRIKDSSLIKYSQKHDNLIITPHIGGATSDAMRKTEDYIVNKFIDITKN